MKKGFFRGVLILMAGSAVSRVLGFIYRIYMVRLIGAEGIGLYEMVFPVITLVLVLTTAGIPVAVAKLVADDSAHGRYRKMAAAINVSMLLLIITGTLIPSLLMYGAPWFIPLVFSDPRAYWPFMTLIPAIFFVSISSVLRGYYQGINYMTPLACGQLIEQITRFIVGIALVSWLLPFGLEFGAGALAFAVVMGEGAGLLVLMSFYWGNRPKAKAAEIETKRETGEIIKQLWHLSAPVTMSRILATIMLSAKAVIIPNRLQLAGATIQQATQIYGAFSGMAMSLLNFPTVITSSLSSVLLPTMAFALSQKHYQLLELRVNQAVKITILTALPFSVLFFLLAEPLTHTFFNNLEAAVPLKFLAPGCVFIYLQQTTAGMLYGLGKMKRLFANSLLGNSIGLLVTYFLTGWPSFGIIGAVAGVLAGSVITCSLNITTIFRNIPITLELGSWLAKGVVATAVMAIFIILLERVLNLFLLVVFSGSLYLAALLVLKGLKWQDFYAQ